MRPPSEQKGAVALEKLRKRPTAAGLASYQPRYTRLSACPLRSSQEPSCKVSLISSLLL